MEFTADGTAVAWDFETSIVNVKGGVAEDLGERTPASAGLQGRPAFILLSAVLSCTFRAAEIVPPQQTALTLPGGKSTSIQQLIHQGQLVILTVWGLKGKRKDKTQCCLD